MKLHSYPLHPQFYRNHAELKYKTSALTSKSTTLRHLLLLFKSTILSKFQLKSSTNIRVRQAIYGKPNTIGEPLIYFRISSSVCNFGNVFDSQSTAALTPSRVETVVVECESYTCAITLITT